MKSLVKYITIYILRALMRILYVFPIKNDRVIFSSYRGYQYACNPRYISEYLVKYHPGEYEIIWAFQNPNEFRLLEKDGIKVVNYNSLRRFFYEATAKFSINNIGSFSYLPLRKGQEHVNTWHSGLDLECCGMNEHANDKIMRYTIEMSGKETSLFLAANRVFSDYSVKVQFGYYGAILNCGLPRGDSLLNEKYDRIRKEVRRKLGIIGDTKVLMYAPTWRYGGKDAMPKMDLSRLATAMQKRFGEKICVWNRSHHLTGEMFVAQSEYIKDVTKYPDVEELVIACDILVSDYSSIIWDGALAQKTIIQYAPDADTFEKDRGLYVPVGKWCLPLAKSMDGLCKEVDKLDMELGKRNSQKLLKMMGSFETGKAAEICCDWIAWKCNYETRHIFEQYFSKFQGPIDDSLLKEMRLHGEPNR